MGERADDRFRLHVLGQPDLRAPDGRRVGSVLSQPKRLGLLVYLALSPAPAPRERVVATFWPDGDEGRGRNALSQALFHLRRALGDRVVESVEGDRLWISPERLWCDARELLAGGAAPSAELIAASSKELLEGWKADEAPLQAWLEEQRERVRERAARAASPAPAEDTLSAPDPSPPRATTATARAVRMRWVAATAVLALAGVAAATSRLVGGPSTEELAVLLPRVTVATGAADLSAQVVLDEVLAYLPHRDDVRILPAPSASSVPEFRTQLASIGASPEEAPDWILEVSVRVTADEVGVVGLLYRAPALDVPGRESFGVTYDPADGALLEVPREIARGIAAMVERVLAER